MYSKLRTSAAMDFGLAASASLTKLQKRWQPDPVELAGEDDCGSGPVLIASMLRTSA